MAKEDVIRDQMEDTRTSLSEKLETLEKQVTSTVQGTTSGVTETVQTVKDAVVDTVQSVKDSVQDMVDTVKNPVQETISAVKGSVEDGLAALQGAFDLPAQVNKHPWAMIGGAVVAGFLLERLIGAWDDAGENASGAPRKPGFFEQFQPEIGRLKALALGALMQGVQGMVTKAVPQNLASPLGEVFNNLTEKVGGEPVATAAR